jgi:hypothetical protein
MSISSSQRKSFRQIGAIITVGLTLLLARCNPVAPIETSRQAIAIGSTACAHSWGVDFMTLDWRARFFNGDRWDVWVDGEKGTKLDIIVYRTGETSACAMYGKFVRNTPK